MKIYDGTHQTPNYINDGIKFVSVENISNLEGTNKYISKDDYDKDFKIKPEINDVLMTRIGDIGTPAIIDTNENYAYYVSLALLKSNQEILFPKFFIQRILSESFQHELWKRTLHVAFPKKINKNEIGECNVFICSKSEQEKIASFLTLLDKKIEKQKELVELLKKYKRGLLSSIFSQNLRFKDNDGSDYPTWEEKRLEEILKIKHGKSQKEIECTNGKYPILATGGEIGRTNSCLWNKPCVLIGRKGTIDKPQYMETPFWTVDTLFYSEVFKDNNAKYLYYLFNTINWKKYDESTGVPSLSAKTIERIKVTLSISNTEQTIISKILSKFDNKIQQEECILSNLQTYKKGLLQQMFI